MSESAQPQLPPLEVCVCFDYACPAYHAHDTEAVTFWKGQAKKLEAENESLKVQIVRGDGSCDHCGRVPAIVMPTSLCDDCVDGIKRAEKAEAERDKALEVIREYRTDVIDTNHAFCFDHNRCTTCIKADALLPKEEA